MAAVTMAPGLPSSTSQSSETLPTLSDTHSSLTSPERSRRNSVSTRHPELSNEVAALSHKLIHAINHQTDLDDTLNETRHELEASQERARQLEYMVQEHRSLVTNGILVQKSDVESDTLRLRVNLAEERKQRAQAEKDKKAIEQELESLTTALFEEANQMVSAARKEARKEREAVERRNEQLQAKLNDAELLLASHQEQLAELKTAMQDMSVQRNDLETVTSSSTAPATPAIDTSEHMNKIFDALHLSPAIAGDEFPPAPPTTFSQLISPVLRTDVAAYEDFQLLLEISRRSGPPSRVTSGNYGGLAGLGLTNVTKHEQSQASGRLPSNGSTSSLAASNNHSNPGTPTMPHSSHSSTSSRDGPVVGTPLKETPFYKRVLVEDLEPTLRLDTAPGLSWLARRGVISSMCDGKLFVEPTPPSTKLYLPACSLCGEQGRGEKRARTHRFRTSESETAQRYPLCEYCLNRVRASCDFLGFLRMVRDGHWRTDTAHAEAFAWEESVRLRERMFWARIGGGVVPSFLKAQTCSPRSSVEEDKSLGKFPSSQTSLNSQETKPEISSPLAQEVQHNLPTPCAQPQQIQPQKPQPPMESPAQEKALPPPPPPPIDTSEVQRPPMERQGTLPSNGKMDAQRPSLDRQDTLQPTDDRAPLTRTITRSAGVSGSDGNLKGSVAKRAAMFERGTSADAASNQLQASLQASIKSRSPNRRPPSARSPSPAVKPAVAESVPEPPQQRHKPTGSIPGAFDF